MLVALLAALSYELTIVSSARASKPCWKTVVTDWSDGRIEGSYPVSCYRQALHALPEDIRLYSSAVDDIKRALARRVRATERGVAGGVVVRSAASLGGSPGSSGRDAVGVPLVLGSSLALLVALLAGGAFAARRKLPSKRTR